MQNFDFMIIFQRWKQIDSFWNYFHFINDIFDNFVSSFKKCVQFGFADVFGKISNLTRWKMHAVVILFCDGLWTCLLRPLEYFSWYVQTENLKLCKPLKMSPMWPIVGLWNWKESNFSLWHIKINEFSNEIIDFGSLWNCNDMNLVHGVGTWRCLMYFQTIQSVNFKSKSSCSQFFKKTMKNLCPCKGQETWKAIFLETPLSKNQTKLLKDFCPSLK